MAQPSDLRSFVPGQSDLTLAQIFSPPSMSSRSEEPSFEQFLRGGRQSSPATPQQTQPQASAPAAGADPLSTFGTDPAAAGAAPPSVDDLLAAFGEPPPAASPAQNRVVQPGDELEIGGQGAGFKARFRAGLGRNLQEQASLFEKSFGTGNVKIKENKIFFRRPGEKRFKAVEPDELGFWSDLISDLVADNSGALVEGGISAISEATGATAGTILGGPAGTVRGYLVGASGGGFAGAMARQGLVADAGGKVDPSISLLNEGLTGAALNVGALGVGAALKEAGKGAISLIKSAYLESPLGRIKALAKINAALEGMAQEYRVGEKGVVGQAIKTASERERTRLNTQVQLSRDVVLKRAGEQKFSADTTLAYLKETLEKQGIEFDKDGSALYHEPVEGQQFLAFRPSEVPTGLVTPTGDQLLRTQVERIPGQLPDRPSFDPAKPFGAQQGRSLMQVMVNDYNRLLSDTHSGGVPARDLFNYASFYGDAGDFQKEFGTKVTTQYRKLGHEAAVDRDRMVGQVLGNSPAGDYFRQAYAEYTGKTDQLRQFEKIVKKAEAAGGLGLVTDAVIQHGKPQKIQQFKALFGDETSVDPELGDSVWKAVKGDWMMSTIKKSTDPSTGILDGKQLLKMLRSYGDETLREVLAPDELTAMRKLAVKSQQIFKSDIAGAEDYTKFVAELPFVSRAGWFLKSKILWQLTKWNAKAADKLLDDQFMDEARKAATPEAREELLKTIQAYRSLHDRAVKVKLKDGREAYRDLPSAAAQGGAAAAGAAMLRDETRSQPPAGFSGADFQPVLPAEQQ